MAGASTCETSITNLHGDAWRFYGPTIVSDHTTALMAFAKRAAATQVNDAFAGRACLRHKYRSRTARRQPVPASRFDSEGCAWLDRELAEACFPD
jgi:hypothetical protein